jgi:beta-lactamase regulating signal transducer with metallopeptidase domain
VLLRLALPLTIDGSIMNRVFSQADAAKAPAIASLNDGDAVSTLGSTMPEEDEQNAASPVSPSTMAPSGNGNASVPAAPETTRPDLWQFALDHLTFIWLFGAALYFGWFLFVYISFSRKTRKTSVPPHCKDMAIFSSMRGAARVQLCCNPYIETPMLIGLISPCIMIPQLAFVENGMASELRHILRHELTHYRRRDLLYKWFVACVSALHWFNPLMILVRREINRCCELSCDEAVIHSLDSAQRQGYGETLLAIASSKRLPAGVVTTTMCEGKRELKERLQSIMTYQRKGVLTVALSVILALLIGGCSVALGAANVTSGASEAPSATNAVVSASSPAEASPNVPAASAPEVSANPAAEATPSPAATVVPEASATAMEVALPSAAESADFMPSASENSVLEAYSAVLRNKAEFNSTDNNKALYWNDFLTNKELYGTSFDVTRYAILDMDGDNAPEVVLELSVGGDPQFFEILHDMNGTVNGYLMVYRGLEDLKSDGTFQFSNGAADYGWGKLSFEAAVSATSVLGYSQSSVNDGALSIEYFVKDKPVSKKAFDAFATEQSSKKEAAWSVYT